MVVDYVFEVFVEYVGQVGIVQFVVEIYFVLCGQVYIGGIEQDCECGYGDQGQ